MKGGGGGWARTGESVVSNSRVSPVVPARYQVRPSWSFPLGTKFGPPRRVARPGAQIEAPATDVRRACGPSAIRTRAYPDA